jgi:hypothetical protein
MAVVLWGALMTFASIQYALLPGISFWTAFNVIAVMELGCSVGFAELFEDLFNHRRTQNHSNLTSDY